MPCFTLIYKQRLPLRSFSESEKKKAAAMTGRLPAKPFPLKVETDLRGERTRCDVVCAAERGKKVVKGVIVCQVDGGQLRAHFVFVAMEQVVMADRDIEKTPRGDALWIVIVVLC